MKLWKKIAIAVVVLLVLAGAVGLTVHQSSKNLVTVQTGKAMRQDLSTIVSASCEIKPKTYVNIGANAFGKITHLYVKEGDHVKEGQMLATLENVQPEADVSANDAALKVSETDYVAAEAAVNTATADQKQAEAEYERAKLDYDRSEALYQAQLIAKSDYDTKKAAYGTTSAQLNQAKAKLAQSKAQMDSSGRRIAQNE